MKNGLFKKSMSVFLAMLMLMSAWVFVAPTQAEAVTTYSGITSVQPYFANSSNTYYVTGGYYNNILYSSNVSGTASNRNAATGYAALSNASQLDVAVYYPDNTVVLYDGKNDMLIPVMASGQVDTKNKNRYIYAIYPTSGTGSTADSTEVSLINYWIGSQNNDDTGTSDFDYSIKQSNNTGTGYSSTALKSTIRLHRQTVLGRGRLYWMANALKVNGANLSFGDAYYTNINSITWKWYAGNSTTTTTTDGCQNIMTASKNIYVINYKPVVDALDEAAANYDSIVNNSSYCSTKINAYKSAVSALEAVNPTSYSYSSNPASATSSCAAAIKSAVEAYNSAKANLGHTAGAAATCTTAQTCTVCGATIKAATGHTWTAATCSAPKTCSVCGTTEGTASGHTEVTVAGKAATCTEDGLTDGKKCSVCGVTTVAQQTISSTGHSYTSKVTAPTCTGDGYTTYTCSACGDTYVSDYTDMIAHSYEAKVTKEATHLEEGETTYTCSCGDTYKEPIAKTTEHTYDAVVTKPTCTAGGYTTYTCACGDTYVADEVASPGHTPGEAKVENEVPSTCTVAGSYDSVVCCSVCGEEISRTTTKLPLAAHTEATVNIPATCTNQGVEGRVECSVCHKIIIEGTVTNKGDHEFKSVPKTIIPATCTTGKISVYECKYCNETKTVEDVDAAGNPITAPHMIIEYERMDATCEEDGFVTTICSTCDTMIKTVVIPATGHVDADEDGTCDNCNGSYVGGDKVCGCICHKTSGIMKFLYKILRFFWKLFGIGKSCGCGAIHY